MSVISMKQLLEAGVHFGHQTRRWNPKMAQYIFTERNGIYIIDLQKTVKKAEEAYKAMEAGVHFGHQTRRWNPKMAQYIFTERNGIYIIDLQKTVKKAEEAYKAMKEIAETGKPVLFVGTKKQAQEAIKEEAERCGMFYVNERWLGGMLTNHKTIQTRINPVLFVGTKKQAQEAIKEEAERCGMFYVNERWLGGMLTNHKTIQTRINKLRELERMENEGVFEVLPKKEVIKLRAEKEKLEKYLNGMKDMPELPGAMFVVDPRKENIAIQEAHRLGIPVFGIVDTNCDPEELDYAIPGNDDAIRAVKLITGAMANAIIEARQGAEEEVEAEQE